MKWRSQKAPFKLVTTRQLFQLIKVLQEHSLSEQRVKEEETIISQKLSLTIIFYVFQRFFLIPRIQMSEVLIGTPIYICLYVLILLSTSFAQNNKQHQYIFEVFRCNNIVIYLNSQHLLLHQILIIFSFRNNKSLFRISTILEMLADTSFIV